MPIAYDVLGIGNALLDIIAQVPDNMLETIAIPKGAMSLADEKRAKQIYQFLPPGITTSGGSVGNTMAGLSMLGARAAFVGRVADDEFARLFHHDMQSVGVEFLRSAQKEKPGATTGHCLVMVTPDKERTMATCLGVSALLAMDNIPQHEIGKADILYLEGYLFDNPTNMEAYELAAQIAHTAGRRVAFSLSDVFCIERHRKEMLDFIAKYVDILFGNVGEIMALGETNDHNLAISQALGKTAMVCCTFGEKGAGVYTDLEKVELPAIQPAQLVDLTGAGDQFAAGFLYGVAKKWSLTNSCSLGINLASHVIAKYGGRPDLLYAQDLLKGGSNSA
ncbi:MAG: adenosine kinase [Pseudomonadota bacterium]